MPGGGGRRGARRQVPAAAKATAASSQPAGSDASSSGSAAAAPAKSPAQERAAALQSLMARLARAGAAAGGSLAQAVTEEDISALERARVELRAVCSPLDVHVGPGFWTPAFALHAYALQDFLRAAVAADEAAGSGGGGSGGGSGSAARSGAAARPLLTLPEARAQRLLLHLPQLLMGCRGCGSAASGPTGPLDPHLALALLRSGYLRGCAAVLDVLSRRAAELPAVAPPSSAMSSASCACTVCACLVLTGVSWCGVPGAAPREEEEGARGASGSGGTGSGGGGDGGGASSPCCAAAAMQVYEAWVQALGSSQLLEAACRAAVRLNEFVQRQQLEVAAAAAASSSSSSSSANSSSPRLAALDSLLADLRAMHACITQAILGLTRPLTAAHPLGALHPRPLAPPSPAADRRLLALLPVVRRVLSGTAVQYWAGLQLLGAALSPGDDLTAMIRSAHGGDSSAQLLHDWCGLPPPQRVPPALFDVAGRAAEGGDTGRMHSYMEAAHALWQVTVSGPTAAAAAAAPATDVGNAGGGVASGGSGAAAAFRLPVTVPFKAAQLCRLLGTALRPAINHLPQSITEYGATTYSRVSDVLGLRIRLVRELRAREAARALQPLFEQARKATYGMPHLALNSMRPCLAAVGSLLLHEYPREREEVWERQPGAAAAAGAGAEDNPAGCPLALRRAVQAGFVVSLWAFLNSTLWAGGGFGDSLCGDGLLERGALGLAYTDVLLRQSHALPALLTHGGLRDGAVLLVAVRKAVAAAQQTARECNAGAGRAQVRSRLQADQMLVAAAQLLEQLVACVWPLRSAATERGSNAAIAAVAGGGTSGGGIGGGAGPSGGAAEAAEQTGAGGASSSATGSSRASPQHSQHGCSGQEAAAAAAATGTRNAALDAEPVPAGEANEARLRAMMQRAATPHGPGAQAALAQRNALTVFAMSQLLPVLVPMCSKDGSSGPLLLGQAAGNKAYISALGRVFLTAALQIIAATHFAGAAGDSAGPSGSSATPLTPQQNEQKATIKAWSVLLSQSHIFNWLAFALQTSTQLRWPEGHAAALDVLEAVALALPRKAVGLQVRVVPGAAAAEPPTRLMPLLGEGWLRRQGRGPLAAVLKDAERCSAISSGSCSAEMLHAIDAHFDRLLDCVIGRHAQAGERRRVQVLVDAGRKGCHVSPGSVAAELAAGPAGYRPCAWPGCTRPDLRGEGVQQQRPQQWRCDGCDAVWYCCERCQRAHWRAGHKVDCEILAGVWAALRVPTD
ncbi:hypothetical protein HYH02_003533 [Chlamydomonas schloesseri]|uniref:phytol kinase n=1 Tax=Chlamydomonas schloesseri TaxID=2026947 RepID=A0A835WPN7_9CHLO|nr:hypothetical protein HYH02_003533 [Chlamydomonas schloesseri]|eukprot:KAG2451754.1 hypothetical protein HYH02_003533 [Chlamydomonas schloesseri]